MVKEKVRREQASPYPWRDASESMIDVTLPAWPCLFLWTPFVCVSVLGSQMLWLKELGLGVLALRQSGCGKLSLCLLWAQSSLSPSLSPASLLFFGEHMDAEHIPYCRTIPQSPLSARGTDQAFPSQPTGLYS